MYKPAMTFSLAHLGLGAGAAVALAFGRRPKPGSNHHGQYRDRQARRRRHRRGPPAHRRRADRGRVGQALRQHQPGHRRGARRGRRRVGRRHGEAPSPRPRRAFDETDWSTNRAFRRRCLEQLQAAIESEREEYRAELVAEVGCPIMLTYGPQLDAPLEDGLLWPAAVHRPVRVGAQAARRSRVRWQRGAHGREGGRGSGRRDRAVELPARSHAPEGGPGAGHRQHHDPEARARHAVERDAPRPARRRAHRHPGGRVQRDRVVGSPRRRGAGHRPARRPHLVHRFDGHRQAHHGEGRADDEAPVPRARRQVRRHRARRRRPTKRSSCRWPASARTVGRVA